MAKAVNRTAPGKEELEQIEEEIRGYWESFREDSELDGSLEEQFHAVITDSFDGEYGELRLQGNQYDGTVRVDQDGEQEYVLTENTGILGHYSSFLTPDYTERDEFLEQLNTKL